jgi:hypothetical protein
LAQNHSRKSNVFYWSFQELGAKNLCHEETWFTVTLTKVSTAKKLQGGIVGLTSIVMDAFFGGASNFVEGIRISCKGLGEHTVYAKMGILLADEPAIKEVMDSKGHAGTKACMLCANGVLHKQPRCNYGLWERSRYFVSLHNPDFSKFLFHTDASIAASVRRVRTLYHGGNKTRYNECSQAMGFNYNPFSLILRAVQPIKPASMLMYDWVHCFLCDGAADVELGMFMKRLRSLRVKDTSFKELREYVKTWTFPKVYGNSMVERLFSESAITNNLKKESFGSSASEFLTLTPVMLLYFVRIATPRHADQARLMPYVLSIIAVLQCVILLSAIKFGTVSYESLRDAIFGHYAMFIAAYGEASSRPKLHYAQHLPDMFRRFEVLFGTLINERKHRVVKRETRNRSNQTRWDLGSLEEITVNQLREQQRGFFKSGHLRKSLPPRETLEGLRELFPKAGHFSVSAHIRSKHGESRVGDVVLYVHSDGQRRAGMLLANFATDGVEYSVVEVWTPLALDVSPRFLKAYRINSELLEIPTSSVVTSLTYRAPSGGARVCYAIVPEHI